MKLEDQVCSLELAKRLKELGVTQETLCYWVEPVYSTVKMPILVMPMGAVAGGALERIAGSVKASLKILHTTNSIEPPGLDLADGVGGVELMVKGRRAGRMKLKKEDTTNSIAPPAGTGRRTLITLVGPLLRERLPVSQGHSTKRRTRRTP